MSEVNPLRFRRLQFQPLQAQEDDFTIGKVYAGRENHFSWYVVNDKDQTLVYNKQLMTSADFAARFEKVCRPSVSQ